MSSQIKLPNPETIRDYVTQALSEVDMLNSGQYQWRTSIPVQMSDSDVRISNALYCVSPLLDELAALQAENERLRAEVAEYQAHKRCYAEGERASEIGVRHTENPYTWGTLEFTAWFGGWFVKRLEIDKDFSI